MTVIKSERLLGTEDFNDNFNRSIEDPVLRIKIIQLVVDNSLWVDPRVYDEIQVVFPQTKRRSGKQKRGDVDGNGNTIWNNEPAKWAFWNAIGLNYYGLKNSYICHIYEGSVTNPGHFTNLANMVAFPRATQSLSEWAPINDILKYRSYELYHYTGPDEKVPSKPEQYEQIKFKTIHFNNEELSKIIEKLKRAYTSRPGYVKMDE
jgi:hypothetical protein